MERPKPRLMDLFIGLTVEGAEFGTPSLLIHQTVPLWTCLTRRTK